jgi:hypothetical protein
MDAEEFLANLRRGTEKPTMPTHHNVLLPEIEFAASRGLKLAPVRGQSRFASAPSSRLVYPTADKTQLLALAAEYSPCNWSMMPDGVVVFEYNSVLGRHSLWELCDDDWDGWRDTLQFHSGITHFLLFRHRGQKLRVLGPRQAGLRLHSGVRERVPVPPSRFLTGPQFVWSNQSAIEELPWFLVDEEGGSSGTPPPTAPAIPPFASGPYERCYVYGDCSW